MIDDNGCFRSVCETIASPVGKVLQRADGVANLANLNDGRPR